MKLLAHQVLLRVLLTEKSSSQEGTYVFLVHASADKPSIRAAVEELFSVKVSSVNTLVYKPLKRYFGRKPGVQKGYKKAYVRLASGQIDFHAL